MKLSSEIILRPKSSLELVEKPERLLTAFEEMGKLNNDVTITRIDDLVIIKFPNNKQHFWSSQLHLEIYKINLQPTVLKGLYGPIPTVWTLIIFLHFVIDTLFISDSIWVYTNSALG